MLIFDQDHGLWPSGQAHGIFVLSPLHFLSHLPKDEARSRRLFQMEKELWCELFMPWRNCPGNAGPVPGGNHISMGQNHLSCEDSSHLTISPRFPVSYRGYASCVKEQPPTGQDLSKLTVGCLALSHDGLPHPHTPSPSRTLLASSSSHHFRSALPILPVCLPGSIKDPCVGLVTSYPALKEL